MSLKLLKFPESNGIKSVADGLRTMADDIEAGKYEDAHNLAWVIDCGNSNIQFGLMGKSESTGAVWHLLVSLAKHKLMQQTLEIDA